MSENRNGNGKPLLPITFDSVRDKNVEQLRVLNNVIFPIRYQEKFYKDCLACQDVNQFALYNDVSVGAIGSRLEKQPDGTAKLHIMTLGVLAPYRGMGVGSRLLQRVLDFCKQDPNIVEVFLHVQVNNQEAVDFYTKFGFSNTGTAKDYYKKLDPPNAWILSKDLRVLDG
ncbi:hypothetical protein BSKO_03401 [Bryopsis sp. KO-2023]|nr:hypothetical protein BSKO_03401 [Bryopsis sp. KO-2023]